MTGGARYELRFELSGALLCLDFANTLSSRLSRRQQERLATYPDLVSWSRLVGIVTDRQAQRLVRATPRRPGQASAALERAITLREAIYRIFSAIAGGHPPRRADLATLNAMLTQALARSRVVPTVDGFAWGWADDEEALDRMLWPVVWSAVSLLTSKELAAVGECAAPNCSWLFLDTSRNHRRRWCDMKVCGNRAKARRHYERQKAGRETLGDPPNRANRG